MKNFYRLLFLLALCVPSALSQVTVTGQAQDSDGQLWFGGSYKIVLVRPIPGSFYRKDNGASFPASFSGTLDSTGSFSVSLMEVSNIVPANSTWQFTICPQVYSATCGTVQIPVNASGSVSAQINAVITAPRVTGGPGVYAYSTIEVSAFPNNSFFNVTTQVNECYTTAWAPCNGSGGGVAAVLGVAPISSSGGQTPSISLLPLNQSETISLFASLPGCGTANYVLTPAGGDCVAAGGAAPVSSVFGRVGAVVQVSGDYTVGQITGAAPLASPAFTGTPTAPTQAISTNNTDIATTAAVTTALGGYIPTAGIPATSALLKGSGTAGSAVAATPWVDYMLGVATNVVGLVPLSTGGSTSQFTWGPIPPGGSNTQVQYNNLSSLGGDPTFTFNNSTKTVGFQNGIIQPLGTAVSGTNYNSGIFQLCSSFWSGSAAAEDCMYFQEALGTGTNPASFLNVTHAGTGGGNGDIIMQPFLGLQNGGTSPTFSVGDSAAEIATDQFVQYHSGQVTAQAFGAYGDAALIPNGCTTNGTTTVVCPGGPFVSTDVGKSLWVSGAGAAGVAFGAAISTYVSSTTVTVASTPSTNVTTATAIYGHDDVAAIQACFNYSGVNGVQCVLTAPTGLNTPRGYLVAASGLTIPTYTNSTGAASAKGTTLFIEYNGDALSLPTSTASLQVGQPIQGVTLSNFSLLFDPSQPNGRGLHLNAAVGIFGFGGMYTSIFNNLLVENAALECLWLDGGNGGADLPNQYLTFNLFTCNGPNQAHPANEIKITGQAAQILFTGGAINGVPTHSFYPNWLINVTQNGAQSPVDVKFYDYTTEVGTQGMFAGPSTSNIHYDNGYMEQIDTTFGASETSQFTFNGNHLANSGNVTAVVDVLATSSGSVRDNYVYGTTTPAALAVCAAQSSIDFTNNLSSVMTTTNCATPAAGIASSTLTLFGGTSLDITSYGGGPVTTIAGSANYGQVNPGKTLTLYASASFVLGSGGNINLGGYSSPLTIPIGGSVVLTLLDQGATWLVTSVTPSASSAVTSVFTRTGAVVAATGDYSLSQISAGSAGTGIYDFSGSTNFKLPVVAGYTATASGECGHDSTNHNFHCYDNGADNFIALFPSASPPTSGHVAGFLSTGGAWTLQDLGALPSVPVTSVFTRTGAVVATSGDYTAAQVTNAAATNTANTFTGAQTAPNFVSNVAIGTQPYATTSTTLNTNLNANFVGGVALAGLCQTGGTGCPSAAPVNSGTGTITVAAGAGSGATASCVTTCNAQRGRVSVVAGTLPTAGTSIFTVTFGTAYANTNYMCSVTMNGGATFLIPAWAPTSATVMTVSTTVAVAGTTEFDYLCAP